MESGERGSALPAAPHGSVGAHPEVKLPRLAPSLAVGMLQLLLQFHLFLLRFPCLFVTRVFT